MAGKPAEVKVVDFEGTLAQLRRASNRQHVHLLFKSGAGTRICLSRNGSLLQSMHVGNLYRVQGRESTIGSRTYLYMTSVLLVGSKADRFKKRTGVLAGALGLLIVFGLGFGDITTGGNELHERQTSSDKVRLQDDKSVVPAGAKTSIERVLEQNAPAVATPQTAPEKTDSTAGLPQANKPAVVEIRTNPVVSHTVPTPIPSAETSTPAATVIPPEKETTKDPPKEPALDAIENAASSIE